MIVEGPIARQIGALDDDGAPPSRSWPNSSGDSATRPASPVDYIEQNWTTERYSGGGMLSHAPPGVLTEFGQALREPCGRIHWAGTESSAVMCGWVDGAVRSGERAASEVMERQKEWPWRNAGASRGASPRQSVSCPPRPGYSGRYKEVAGMAKYSLNEPRWPRRAN